MTHTRPPQSHGSTVEQPGLLDARHSVRLGDQGEDEVMRLLHGCTVEYRHMTRDQQRYEDGKADFVLRQHILEVKRYTEGPFQQVWWHQAVAAARHWNRQPAVAYRFNHQRAWRAKVWHGGLLIDTNLVAWLLYRQQAGDRRTHDLPHEPLTADPCLE